MAPRLRLRHRTPHAPPWGLPGVSLNDDVEQLIVEHEIFNKLVDELGAGGIMAPAMFYAPAAGAKAVPENIQPLGRIFSCMTVVTVPISPRYFKKSWRMP